MSITVNHQTNAITASSGQVTLNGFAPGVVTATASGSITTGKPVVANSDGTVSMVAVTPAGGGAAANYNANTTVETTAVLDIPGTSTVVAAFRSSGDSQFGYAQVGTVSGSTITWGTKTQFNSAGYTGAYGISMCYDTVNNKVIIVYKQDNSPGYGAAVVGTISGTSISFGTPVVFNSASTSMYDCCFDSANGKVFISYNSSSGTGAYAIIGTVSGTSISFGTAVQIHNVSTSPRPSCCYVADIGKVLVSYASWGVANYFIVGTISGTSVTFGSAIAYPGSLPGYGGSVLFYNPNTTYVVMEYSMSNAPGTSYAVVLDVVSDSSITVNTPTTITPGNGTWFFDSTNNRLIQNTGSLYYYQVTDTTVGSVSSAITYATGMGTTQHPAGAFNVGSGRVVATVQSFTLGSKGYGFSVTLTSTVNLTATNYIGVSAGTYSDTQTATVLIAGSVSSDQSGLTAGSQYYVQTDGTLSTTAGSPSVVAGTAVAATKLIVKG